jgi:hypothetical protein
MPHKCHHQQTRMVDKECSAAIIYIVACTECDLVMTCRRPLTSHPEQTPLIPSSSISDLFHTLSVHFCMRESILECLWALSLGSCQGEQTLRLSVTVS